MTSVETGERVWLLPGGGLERGETLAQAAVREVLEETGVAVKIVRRLRTGPRVSEYALFLAEANEHTIPAPTVDLAAERYLVGAAWHSITPSNPLGPLDPRYWAFLERRLRTMALGSNSESD